MVIQIAPMSSGGIRMGRLREFYERNIKIYLTWQNAMWFCLFAGIWSNYWMFYAAFAAIFWWNTYQNFKIIYPMVMMKYGKKD